MHFRHRLTLWVGLSVVMVLALVVSATFVACGGSEVSRQAKAHVASAQALVEQGDQSGAIEEYSRAIELNPESEEAYEGRAAAYASRGNFERAIADFTRAIEFHPDGNALYYARGVAYRKRGSLDQAIADFSQIIGDRGKTLARDALYQRGLAYKQKGLLAEARADFTRILQLEIERPGEPSKDWVDNARSELSELSR